MCMYVYINFVIGFFPFFVRLGPLGLKLLWCGISHNIVAMLQCGGPVRTLHLVLPV